MRGPAQDWSFYTAQLRKTLRRRSVQFCIPFAFWQLQAPREAGGIYELRSYRLKPGRLLEWEHHWRRGLECRRQFCEPVGAWFSQLGELNMVHHLWAYQDLHRRKVLRESAWSVSGWAETVYNTGAWHGAVRADGCSGDRLTRPPIDVRAPQCR